MNDSREPIGNLIGMAGSAVVFPLVWVFEPGFPTSFVLSALVFGSASVVSWLEAFRYASVGYLFVALALAVLPMTMQASLLAFAAFLSFALVGCGLVLYEGIARADRKNAERNASTG